MSAAASGAAASGRTAGARGAARARGRRAARGLAGGRARGAARLGERGFSLVEVMVAFVIVAVVLATLQVTASDALRSAIETNRIRAAKVLLLRKAEEVIAGVEQGASGSFEGFPGFAWEVYEQIVPLDGDAEGGVAAEVRSVTVAVRYPTLDGTGEAADLGLSGEDVPGSVRVTVLLDPPEAKLEPPPQ